MEWMPIYFKGEQIGEVGEHSEPGETFKSHGKNFIIGGWADGKLIANMIVPNENGFPRFVSGALEEPKMYGLGHPYN